MDLKDSTSAHAIGSLHGATVEPSGAQQRRVEDLWAVGRRQHDDRLRGLEAVEFTQNLVAFLLTLVVGASKRDRGLSRPPVAPAVSAER